jgi:hypothetical protein
MHREAHATRLNYVNVPQPRWSFTAQQRQVADSPVSHLPGFTPSN